MATPVLEMRNVEKNFGGVRAIDNFSVTLEPGKIHGLIGPNGAGKTTIFNNITDEAKASVQEAMDGLANGTITLK